MASSVESYLTRQLDLRFIDARSIATEARISLGIEGYPTKNQIYDLRQEAIRIFQSKSIDERRTLQHLNMELEAVKTPAGSMRSCDLDSHVSDQEQSSSDSERSLSLRSGLRSIFRR